MDINSDFFQVSFINLLQTMLIMVTNQKIAMDILKMKTKKPYDVLVVIGPSGVGKSSFMSCLPDHFQQMKVTSTRSARKTDNDDKELVSKNEFAKMFQRGDFAGQETHAGNSYGVKKKDIQAAVGNGKIAVMDFKGEAYKQIKLRADISARVVSITYQNIEDAAKNLQDRQKKSDETDNQIDNRLKLIEADQKYIDTNKEQIDANIEFIRTLKEKAFWNLNIKKVI